MKFRTGHRFFDLCTRTRNKRKVFDRRQILISVLLGILTIPTSAVAAAKQLSVSVNSPARYKLDVLRVGKQPYVDQKFKFTGVPSRFANLCFLRTATKDNFVSNNRFVTLNANNPVAVFVGLDSRMNTPPVWIKKGWAKTGYTLDFKANNRQKFVLYRKFFPAGKIVLGGNEKGYKTYVVAVQDRNGSNPRTCNFTKKLAVQNTPSKRLNLKIGGAFKHQIGVAQNNTRAYIDRSFRLTSVPKTYRGMCYIRPADNNHFQSNRNSLVLNASKKVNVYVGFDARMTNLPAWVNKTWKKTGSVIGLQAGSPQKMKLYRKTFPAGKITLGGNEMGFRHYVTLVADPNANGVTSCSSSAKPPKSTLTLSWKPSHDNIAGYRIYQGTSRQNVSRLVSVVRVNNPSFDQARPSIKFDAWKLLGDYQGKTTCFKVSAFSSSGESKKSTPLCRKL